MSILNSYKLAVVAGLLLVSGANYAQPGPSTDPTISGSSSGVNKDWAASKTPDGAFDRVPHVSQAIPWQHLREDDIMWRKRVWREIDTREKQNVAFRYMGDENTGGGMFIEILIDAIKRGKIKAYSNFDDRFTQILTKDVLIEQLAGKTDTVPVTDPITGAETMMIRHRDFNPETIVKYRIKEDWIFDRNEGKMIVRIDGIAPVQAVLGDNGEFKFEKAMFWLYYPDIRNLLAQYEVFNPENDAVRYTWDEFFETRQFSSKITKVSNPFGAGAGQGGEDYKNYLNPMETLYEGKRASETIFNKEHDMWVY